MVISKESAVSISTRIRILTLLGIVCIDILSSCIVDFLFVWCGYSVVVCIDCFAMLDGVQKFRLKQLSSLVWWQLKSEEAGSSNG